MSQSDSFSDCVKQNKFLLLRNIYLCKCVRLQINDSGQH